MIIGFVHKVRVELEGDLDNLKQSICNGNVKDFEEYRFMTGQMLGLKKALAVLDDEVKRFDEAH